MIFLLARGERRGNTFSLPQVAAVLAFFYHPDEFFCLFSSPRQKETSTAKKYFEKVKYIVGYPIFMIQK